MTERSAELEIDEPREKRKASRGVRKRTVIPRHNDADVLRSMYEHVCHIGTGSFGTVSHVRDLTFDQDRVCKFVSTKGMQQQVVNLIRREIELLCTLDHPSIVKLFEYALDETREEFILILEHIPGGNGLEMLQKHGALPGQLVARLIYQVLVALSYCHNAGITHRDMKLENIMLVYGRGPDSDPDCRLIDYGLAGSNTAGNTDYVGSPRYMAPEVHRRERYTGKADIWSVGICAIEWLSGKFEHTVDIANLDDPVTRFSQKDMWPKSDDGAVEEFLHSLLMPDHLERPMAIDALDDAWLNENRGTNGRLTADMARSLTSYCYAPPFVRCCLLCIAARVGVLETEDNEGHHEAIGAAFLAADCDGDGFLSCSDLETTVSNMEGWIACWDSLDVGNLIEAADLDHDGGLSYTEFVAVCLYGTLENLTELAFEALDSDRDGLVSVDQIRVLFRERDGDFLATLPQGRPFSMVDWCRCADDYGHGHCITVCGHISENAPAPRRDCCGCKDTGDLQVYREGTNQSDNSQVVPSSGMRSCQAGMRSGYFGALLAPKAICYHERSDCEMIDESTGTSESYSAQSLPLSFTKPAKKVQFKIERGATPMRPPSGFIEAL